MEDGERQDFLSIISTYGLMETNFEIKEDTVISIYWSRQPFRDDNHQIQTV